MLNLLTAGLLSAAVNAAGPVDPSSCVTRPAVEAQIAAEGQRVVGEATYHGTQTDSMIIVEGDLIYMIGFKDGCWVGSMAVEAGNPATPA